jgi:hypothetical protein
MARRKPRPAVRHTSSEVLAHLQRAFSGKVFTKHDVAHSLGYASSSAVLRHLSILRGQRQLVSVGWGQYSLPSPGGVVDTAATATVPRSAMGAVPESITINDLLRLLGKDVGGKVVELLQAAYFKPAPMTPEGIERAIAAVAQQRGPGRQIASIAGPFWRFFQENPKEARAFLKWAAEQRGTDTQDD